MSGTTIEAVHQDILALRKDVEFIKHVISEDLELSSWAKNELAKARKTPKGKYVKNEDMISEFLK